MAVKLRSGWDLVLHSSFNLVSLTTILPSISSLIPYWLNSMINIFRKRQLVDVKIEDDAVRSPKSPKSASHLSFLQVRDTFDFLLSYFGLHFSQCFFVVVYFIFQCWLTLSIDLNIIFDQLIFNSAFVINLQYLWLSNFMITDQGRLAEHLSPLQTASAPPMPSTILVRR